MKRFGSYIRTQQGKFATYTGAEKVSSNSDDPSSRFTGTSSLTDIYKSATPGQHTVEPVPPEPETPEGDVKDK